MPNDAMKPSKAGERDAAPLTLEFVLTEVKRILDEERAGVKENEGEAKLAA